MRRLVIIVLLLFPAVTAAQPVPTAEWISVWSDEVTFNARAARPGSVVRAYDPDGVLCGEFTVTTAGSYGLMPVYRDDPLTPGLDEGAGPGELIRFTVGGEAATTRGPDAPMWGSNGQIKRVDIDVPGSPSGARPGPGSRLAIHPNRPNPFGGFTVFDIEVTDDAPVDVTVYDVRGRVVRRLVRDGRFDGGAILLRWDGRGDSGALAPKGIYFVELTQGTRRTVQKMAVVR